MAEILKKNPELVDKVTKKLKVLEDKAEEFFELEEDDYLAESKEILKMKIGSKMLDGYKNIDMLNTGDNKPLVDLGDNMKGLNDIIDELKPITTQKIEKKSNKFIPEKLLGEKNENAGQMMIVKQDTTSQGEKGQENALDLFSKSKQRQLGAIYIDKIKKIIGLHVKLTAEHTDAIALITSEWVHLEKEFVERLNAKPYSAYLELREKYETDFKAILQHDKKKKK